MGALNNPEINKHSFGSNDKGSGKKKN